MYRDDVPGLELAGMTGLPIKTVCSAERTLQGEILLKRYQNNKQVEGDLRQLVMILLKQDNNNINVPDISLETQRVFMIPIVMT